MSTPPRVGYLGVSSFLLFFPPLPSSVLSTLFSPGVVVDILASVHFKDTTREAQQVSDSRDHISFIHFVTH